MSTNTKQIAGLSIGTAIEIRTALVWLETSPEWAYERAASMFQDWILSIELGTEESCPIDATDDGFLWMDENGKEWEHLCL